MKHFRISAVLMTLALLAAAPLLTACGGSDVTVHNRMVSPQQSAADLKRALDAGIISQDEYQEEMEKLHDAQ
jgi:hypothetical protein